jgi:hypothetical protein
MVALMRFLPVASCGVDADAGRRVAATDNASGVGESERA